MSDVPIRLMKRITSGQVTSNHAPKKIKQVASCLLLALAAFSGLLPSTSTASPVTVSAPASVQGKDRTGGTQAVPPDKSSGLWRPPHGDPRIDKGIPPAQLRAQHGAKYQPQRVPIDNLAGKGNRPQVITDGNWIDLYPTLIAVSADSATDAWAVGDYGHLIHYTGGSWHDVDPAGMRGDTLVDIKMLSPTSGWALGFESPYEFDGTSWVAHPSTSDFLLGMSVVSADDVWAVGYYCGSTSCLPSISHWNGTTWSERGPALNEYANLESIAMVSPTDGWAVGYSFDPHSSIETPILLRYNGSSLNSVARPITQGYFGSVAVSGADNVWVLGFEETSNSLTPRTWRYDGSSWTRYTPPGGRYGYSIFPVSSSEVYMASTANTMLLWTGSSWQIDYQGQSAFLVGVAASGGQVWAVGGGDIVMARAGGSWSQQRGGPTGNPLDSVSVLSTDDAWAVGEDVGLGSTILHYTGGSWQIVPNSLSGSLYDVQMLSPTEGYAVGDNVIAEWHGTSWTQVAYPGLLARLSMTGPGEGWAVGGGQIWRDAGGVWSQYSSSTSYALSAIAMDSPSHGWAMGTI